MDFSKAVKKLMIDRDVKQYELGQRLGMDSPQLINAYLARKDYRLTADIARIADALGLDVTLTLIDRETGQQYEVK